LVTQESNNKRPCAAENHGEERRLPASAQQAEKKRDKEATPMTFKKFPRIKSVLHSPLKTMEKIEEWRSDTIEKLEGLIQRRTSSEVHKELRKRYPDRDVYLNLLNEILEALK